MMNRILFVDDEPRVLNGLRRMLHPLRNQWQMEFAANAVEALAALSRESFDIVVTDIRMSGMDGAELLTEVAQQHPEVVRIVLSGQPRIESTLKSANIGHQFLSKPCDSEALKLTITRACAWRELLRNSALQRLVSRLGVLPSVPSIYRQLTEALQNPEAGIQDIGRIIENDTALTAKVLQLVNSTLFGIRTRIASVADAVFYLGIDMVRSLAFSARVFSHFDASGSRLFSIERVSRHCITTAALAQRLMKAENAPEASVQESFLAGLLHDIGKLVLVSTLPQEYECALILIRDRGATVREAELKMFDTTHAEVGGYLLWLWGLPDAITDAATYHHRPRECPDQGLTSLTAVHIADALQHEHDKGEASLTLDLDYLGSLGLTDRLPRWQAMTAGPA